MRVPKKNPPNSNLLNPNNIHIYARKWTNLSYTNINSEARIELNWEVGGRDGKKIQHCTACMAGPKAVKPFTSGTPGVPDCRV